VQGNERECNPIGYLFLFAIAAGQWARAARTGSSESTGSVSVVSSIPKRKMVMSTIDASQDHHGGGRPTARRPQSHSRNVRRLWSYTSAGPSGSLTLRIAITLSLVVASVLLAASGAIHLRLWSTGYRSIPTIGSLFLVQGIAGPFLAALLVLSRRLLIVAIGAGFMIATIGGLLLSINLGLFGFRDTLAAPYAGLSLAVESAGGVILVVVGIVLACGHSH
jgi:hypothetical protein